MSGPEAVKVIVRCRPMNKREKDLKSQKVVHMDARSFSCSMVNPSLPNDPPKSFTFDGVYAEDSTTEQIYNDIGFALVEGVLEGYNGTIFAYGQTGCGKSFSMQGINDPATQRGIIPRSFEHIFEAIDSSENMKYLVHASYLEIYNEEIRDLLGDDIKKKLDLKEHPERGVYVKDISLHPVANTGECEALMAKGWSNRATGATKMNADSSRSHSIFTINIEMMSSTGDGQIRKGKLNLVDLAGSERQAKTEATGARLKEATKINMSLSALGNVISALVDGKSSHIPYRDSKLTRLLQDSLGGNTKTMMVACLSPADNNYEETISTLRYANRAKNIKNKPKINEDPKDAMLREYQEEIEKLRAMVDGGVNVVPNEELLEEERNKIREEYENEMLEMREKYANEQKSKAKMAAEVEDMKKQYEDKLKELEERAKTAKVSSSEGGSSPGGVRVGGSNEEGAITEGVGDKNMVVVNEEQKAALAKLRKLQGFLVDGGKRAGDNDLKERRLKKKKAAEKRLKVLGEALGHVDDEDGVLVKVYDDIQTELQEKNAVLKRMKQRVRGLNTEITDLQSEFERDRQDYLDTIRKQDQQIKLIEVILDKIHPTVRKDCNYSNLERIKQEAVWSDEQSRWRVPDLVVQKTKLPPADRSFAYSDPDPSPGDHTGGQTTHAHQPQPQSRTAPGRLEAGETGEAEADQELNLRKKLMKSEQEDVAGNYFKPVRSNRLIAQAHETKRAVSKFKELLKSKQKSDEPRDEVTLGDETELNSASISPAFVNDLSSSRHGSLYTSSAGGAGAGSGSNLASSFNSGLNTVGLNNGYQNGGGGGLAGKMGSSTGSNWNDGGGLTNGGSYHGINSFGAAGGGAYGGFKSTGGYATDTIRKPTRLEALPSTGPVKKKSVPMLNTMGTF